MPADVAHRTKLVTDFARTPGDTGSPEVQIALLTERINDLTQHLKANSKDHSSRRGLVLMASKRNRLLRYLARSDRDRYSAVLGRLGLRK